MLVALCNLHRLLRTSQLSTHRDAPRSPCRTLQALQAGVDQEATVPHTVPCGEGTAAFERVMRQLGLEVPTEHANAAYNDSDSYSDGDDEDDDDDDDDSAPVRKTARLVPSNGDGQIGAAPAAGAAVAVVVAGLHIPMRGLRIPMRSATTMRSANRPVPVLAPAVR